MPFPGRNRCLILHIKIGGHDLPFGLARTSIGITWNTWLGARAIGLIVIYTHNSPLIFDALPINICNTPLLLTYPCETVTILPVLSTCCECGLSSLASPTGSACWKEILKHLEGNRPTNLGPSATCSSKCYRWRLYRIRYHCFRRFRPDS